VCHAKLVFLIQSMVTNWPIWSLVCIHFVQRTLYTMSLNFLQVAPFLQECQLVVQLYLFSIVSKVYEQCNNCCICALNFSSYKFSGRHDGCVQKLLHQITKLKFLVGLLDFLEGWDGGAEWHIHPLWTVQESEYLGDHFPVGKGCWASAVLRIRII